MKKTNLRAFIACILVFCMMVPMALPVQATGDTGLTITESNTYIETVGTGKMFFHMGTDKHIAIGADETKHLITVSIKYLSTPNDIYEWVIEDYPETVFDMENMSFWTNILVYAEAHPEDARIVTFTYEEIDANDPMVASSAGADLRADLVSLVGEEYTGRYIQTKVVNGIVFKMYEMLQFRITRTRKISWKDGIKLGSEVLFLLGFTQLPTVAKRICDILGVAFKAIDQTMDADELYEYRCLAYYTRYVTVDSGSIQYSEANKSVVYTGHEDASLDSIERARISPEKKTVEYYPYEDYYNNGIFDAAYEAYTAAR